MADALLSGMHQLHARKRRAPQVADLTGGFGKAKGLRELINAALTKAQAALLSSEREETEAPGLLEPVPLSEAPRVGERQGRRSDRLYRGGRIRRD